MRLGHRNPGSWLAELGQTGIGDALGTLEASKRLPELPKTTQAIRQGALSGAQIREIAAAGSVDPDSETPLLATAATSSFKELRDAARGVRAAAADRLIGSERETRIHQARYVRSWVDHDGAFCIGAKCTPIAGALVMAGLEAQAKVHFEEARAAGVMESEAAYLADALVALCTAGGAEPDKASKKGPRALVHLRVDLAALHRRSLEPGEVCEIPGVGRVRLETARALIGDSFLKLFVTNGIDVQTVVNYGRTIPRSVRSALEERDRTCVVPGCSATRFLEIDHWSIPFAQGGPSCLENLARICPHHHRLKTSGDFQLVGGPGYWQFRRVRNYLESESVAGRDPPRVDDSCADQLLPV